MFHTVLHTCCVGARSLSSEEFAYCAWYIVDRFPMIDSYVIGPLMPVHEMICGDQKDGVFTGKATGFMVAVGYVVGCWHSCLG